MMTLLSIGAGGFVGSISRYLLSTQVHLRLGTDFPYGTLIVNALGSLVLGALAGYLREHLAVSEELRLGLTVGFLGAFTTFSTFSYETILLMQSGDYWKMGMNILSNVTTCLILCILGLLLVKSF